MPEGTIVEAQSAGGTAHYGSQLLAFSSVRLLKGPSDGFDVIQCLEKHILLLDLVWECFAAQELSGWKGPKYFDLPMTPRNVTRDERFEEAENLVWKLLSETSMCEIDRGHGFSMDPTLAT